MADDQPVLRPRRPWMRGSLEHASQILQVRYPKLAPADVPCVQDEQVLATVLLRYGTRVEPGRSRTTQPSSIPQRSRCESTSIIPLGLWPCFMASDADPLVSAVSRCILDFSEQRGRSKGEAQEDTVNHALHTLQGLAPARVCAFKSYLWHYSFSTLPSMRSHVSRPAPCIPALLIRFSFDDSRGKHHNIPLRPLPLLSSHPRISLPARRPFPDHGTVPDLLRSGRRLSRELPIRLEEILALTGTLSNEQPITIHEAVIQMVTMTEVCVEKSCDQAAHVWLASA